MIREVQLDGLIGPTHFFGGLGAGNVASETNAGKTSSPRAAALQGLRKMKAVHDLGVMQLVMPPHPRPARWLLKDIGFAGAIEQQINDVAKYAPELLPIIYSSSAMWAANAATVCASVDTADNKVHLTPANLISNAHRALEASFTARILPKIFSGDSFVHHAPLPYNPLLADEGAANHMRLIKKNGEAIHIFVYGAKTAKKYIPRQQAAASHSIARLHQLSPTRSIFLEQCPEAIDAGVFHNDVIATSNDHLLLYHERAYVDDALLNALASDADMVVCKVTAAELSLEDAVKSYLFNSQILTMQNGEMRMLAPMECKHSNAARALIESWISASDNPITSVQYIDLTESMQNGGGPACMRLRFWLNEKEMTEVHQGVQMTDKLYTNLGQWVNAHYPESLSTSDLQNTALSAKVKTALLELEKILDLEGLYDGYF